MSANETAQRPLIFIKTLMASRCSEVRGGTAFPHMTYLPTTVDQSTLTETLMNWLSRT